MDQEDFFELCLSSLQSKELSACRLYLRLRFADSTQKKIAIENLFYAYEKTMRPLFGVRRLCVAISRLIGTTPEAARQRFYRWRKFRLRS